MYLWAKEYNYNDEKYQARKIQESLYNEEIEYKHQKEINL